MVQKPVMQTSHPKPIAVTMGCPSGIGPEIAVAAVREARRYGIDCRIVGDRGVLIDAAVTLKHNPDELFGFPRNEDPQASIPVIETVAPLQARDRKPGAPTSVGGIAQLSWINHATDLAKHGHAAAIATGPVSKEVIARCGEPSACAFRGHTEHIAHRLGSPTAVMVFVADRLAISPVTTHLALNSVASNLTATGVRDTTIETTRVLLRLGVERPRVVVCALNPHAGEGGLLGHEEASIIVPAISAARAWASEQRVDSVIDGPTSADVAFRTAMDGAYDGVVAMYHDQAMIAVKLRFFGRAVNLTAGLPIIRTSVDHGTAYDIAGKGKADAGSLLRAIELADRLARMDLGRGQGTSIWQ